MNTTTISFLSFFAILAAYYYFPLVGKRPWPFGLESSGYANFNRGRLLLFFLMVLLTQFGLVVFSMVNKCHGSVGQNIGSAALITLLPWTLIFGAMIVLLQLYPSLKAPFSDVVGYYFVANQADQLLKTLLTPSSSADASAAAIMKIFGDKSVLINKINPENFETMWTTMAPLIPSDGQNQKASLFNLIVMKDNVGEAMWYAYTGILVIALVSYNLASRGCRRDLATVQANYSAYLDSQKKDDEKKQEQQQ